ncbi:hypothetical protein AGMMS50268_25730 [Spirochaetia bacterium]|nr:hypothetical protein AGMMS50268_25730 [Spirochaetia bacterium]
MKTSNTFQIIANIIFFFNILTLFGCLSIGKVTEFSKSVFSLEDDNFVIRTVSVVVDRVKDEELGEQVNSSAKLFLNQLAPRKGNEYQIDISIIQRSYIKRLSIHNSIYSTAIVKNKIDETVMMREYYLEGEKSIIAADVQNNVVKNLLDSLVIKEKKNPYTRMKNFFGSLRFLLL